MKKIILISTCFAMTLGLFGCQPNQNAHYTIYYQGVPVQFDSPYDDPSFYRGPGGTT